MSKTDWDAYARLQKTLSETRQIHWSHGLEAGLNALLDQLEGATSTETQKAMSSEDRRERHRAALRRRYAAALGDAPPCHPEDRLDARGRLRLVLQQVDPDEFRVLAAIATGSEYEEIAEATHIRAGTLRVRVQRLRSSLRLLAA